MKTIIKYARKCDITSEGMNEGYCILDGMMYIKYEKDMIKHIKDETDYNDIEEAYEDDYYYFTDWFDTIDEEDEWYTDDGSLMTDMGETCRNGKEWEKCDCC